MTSTNELINFCEICGELLEIDDKSTDVFTMKCGVCNKKYKQKSIIISDEINHTDFLIKNMIKNAKYDPTNPREYMDCLECKKNRIFIRIVIPDDTLRNLFICTKCNSIQN